MCLQVNAATTFSGGFLLASNSSTTATGAVLGFQRTNAGAAVSNGFNLGSINFSGFDGAVQGLSAQIRAVFTVSVGCTHS